ncbi:hypothetical protein EU97_0321 [Prochlorococcus marinus str. MIT 9311]|nr:hypothetical protein EU97_0321 [Prochlorococcus marinus str. MIT 9311]
MSKLNWHNIYIKYSFDNFLFKIQKITINSWERFFYRPYPQ